jgi:hypothetical protein
MYNSLGGRNHATDRYTPPDLRLTSHDALHQPRCHKFAPKKLDVSQDQQLGPAGGTEAASGYRVP